MQLRPSLSISYSTIHRLTLPQNPTQVRVGRFSRFANAFRTPSSRGYSTGSGRGVNTSSSSEPTSSSGEIEAGRDSSRESLRSGSNELEGSSHTHASATTTPSADTSTPTPNSTRPNANTTTLSASDKLFLDAAREESSPAAPNKSSYLQYLESQYLNPTSSPNWDGDERMEDAVLRMLVDKYKPLRYGGGGTRGGGIRSAEEKLKERPPRVVERQLDIPGIVEEFERNAKANANASVDDEGSAVTTTATIGNSSVSSLSKTTPCSGSWATESLLPSSEPHRPWHTEYRVPSHVVSSIKLANIPPPPVPPHLRSTGSTVSSSTPLPSSPRLGSTGGGGTKDEKALKKEKEMKKRSETGTRLGKARESTLDYRLGVRDKVLGSQGVNRDGVGGARPNPVSMRGWTGLIEDRIERARSRGVFNNLKGRGKPLTSTMEEKNPFIGREEYLMNRIVQRNGAAPPWVELQGELDNTLQTFRSVLRQSYVRRAIRVLTTLHPPNVLSRLTIADIQARRDKEWEKKEETYHDTAVEEVNALVRKYNGLAPYAVRRAYYMRKVEVERVYEECAEEVLEGIKERLRASGGSSVGVTSGGSDVQRIGGFGAANGREEDPGFVGLADWIWGMIGRAMGRWRG
ncbi:hypothetical protein K435DRAFT_962521 [Dendrothele bispora CBS 962.96]|uniref:DnaJ homologue subfamily C member 28 conserved domain-containing protein n=1 Tax=Dendrothele bispora (strain CBS 962.96) TaxID=1314807 RepID=A0A4S8MLG8_DENBC|nr:hypothetical protein K435DRAFT_962521 [Dendrothele bispora CBS 962.96]